VSRGEHLDHPPGQRLLDPVKLLDLDPVHGVPEPAVVQRGRRDRQDATQRGARPPGSQPRLRPRITDPIQRRQHQVGTHRHPAADPRVAQHTVDHRHRVQPCEHSPDRRDITEPAVHGVIGQRQPVTSRPPQSGDHFVLGTQIHLIHDPRLPADPGRGHRVQVGAASPPLLDDRNHIWVIRPPEQDRNRATPADPQLRLAQTRDAYTPDHDRKR